MVESLEPDHSMCVMLTDSGSVEAAESILTEAGAQLVSHPVNADLASDLEMAAESGEAQVEIAADDDEQA